MWQPFRNWTELSGFPQLWKRVLWLKRLSTSLETGGDNVREGKGAVKWDRGKMRGEIYEWKKRWDQAGEETVG